MANPDDGRRTSGRLAGHLACWRGVPWEPPDLTASNKENGLDEARTEALSAYVAWLEGRPLAARSRQAYGHQVRRYLTWLGDRSPVDGDPLADAAARDWAVRDYKRHLTEIRE